MIVSANKDRADANANFIKQIIHTLPFLAHLKAREGQRDTQNLFDVGPATPDISPSVKSVGITGQLTGSRADVIISDDVEIPKNSATQQQWEKLSEQVKEYTAIIKPGGTIIYPVRFPESRELRDFYGDRLAKFVAQPYDQDPEQWAGKPVEPSRFSEEIIDANLIEYGKAGFALQFLLNTSLSDSEKYPLKVSDLIITDLDLEETSLKWSWASGLQQRLELPCVALKDDYYYTEMFRSPEIMRYTGTVIAVDPSGRGKDETAYAILKFLNGYIFLLEVGGFRDGYSENTLRALCKKARLYGANECIHEPNFGGGMFGQLLTPIMNQVHPGCRLTEAKWSSARKEERIIDTLEPVMMRHKHIVQKQVILDDYKVFTTGDRQEYTYSFIYQLTRISKDKGFLLHDDRLDAVALGVSYWVELMAKDEQMGLEEHAADPLEKWLDPDYGLSMSKKKPRS